MSSVRDLVLDFMSNTTIHGLGPIARSKSRVERFIFVLTFLASAGLLGFSCWNIVAQFIERPIATSYFIQEANTLSLPDITICPFNRLNKNYLVTNNVSAELAKYMEWSFFIISPKYSYVNLTIRDLNAQARNDAELETLLTNLNMSWGDFLENAALACEDIITTCLFEYQFIPCCKRASKIMTSFGRCFRVPGLSQTGSGFGTGNTFILQLPLDKYALSDNMLFNDGVMLKLTEPGKGYEFDAIFIPPGVHALLQLRATKMEFMDIPSYRCRVDAEDDYAPLLCFYKCILEPVSTGCGCRYVGLPVNNFTKDMPVCKPGEVLRCVYSTIANHYKKHADYQDTCKASCRPRCSYWQYDATVSYAKYPSEAAIEQYFHGNRSARNTRLILEVYFEKLEYTTIRHYASITFDQFLADIGGQMSLWMGSSILSVIHLLVFLVFCFASAAPSKKRQKRRHTDTATSRDESMTPLGDMRSTQSNGEVLHWRTKYADFGYPSSSKELMKNDGKINLAPPCYTEPTSSLIGRFSDGTTV